MKKIIMYGSIIIVLIGFIMGINNNFELNILKFSISFKSIILLLILFIILLFLAYFFIPTFLILYIFTLLELGIFLGIFYLNYNLIGLIIPLIIFIIFKSVLCFLYILNTFYSFKYYKNIIKKILYKYGKLSIIRYQKKITLISIFILAIVLFNTFFENILLNIIVNKFLI